jgi:hypothetical protein
LRRSESARVKISRKKATLAVEIQSFVSPAMVERLEGQAELR